MAKKGLYANIHAKQKRIAAGSGERMRKPGSPGAPTNKAFAQSAKTAKPVKKAQMGTTIGRKTPMMDYVNKYKNSSPIMGYREDGIASDTLAENIPLNRHPNMGFAPSPERMKQLEDLEKAFSNKFWDKKGRLTKDPAKLKEIEMLKKHPIDFKKGGSVKSKSTKK